MDNLQSLKRAHHNWKYIRSISFITFIITFLYVLLVAYKILPSSIMFLAIASVICYISFIVLLIAISKVKYYAPELEHAEIIASISEKWEEVSFNETNCVDTFLRTDNISKVLVKKYTDKRIKVKLVFKKAKKGGKKKKCRVYQITLDEARDFIDLDKFID